MKSGPARTCRSQQRRLLRAWQRRAEWSVPRRRKAVAHHYRSTQASTLNQLSRAASVRRWERTLKSVAGRFHRQSSTICLCVRGHHTHTYIHTHIHTYRHTYRHTVLAFWPLTLLGAWHQCSPVVRSCQDRYGIRSMAHVGGKATRAEGQGSSAHVRSTPTRFRIDMAWPIDFTCKAEAAGSRFRQEVAAEARAMAAGTGSACTGLGSTTPKDHTPSLASSRCRRQQASAARGRTGPGPSDPRGEYRCDTG